MKILINQKRSGRYIKQSIGYRAFIPAPLPPEPSIKLEGELQVLLSQADRALGRLDGSIQTLPHPDLCRTVFDLFLNVDLMHSASAN